MRQVLNLRVEVDGFNNVKLRYQDFAQPAATLVVAVLYLAVTCFFVYGVSAHRSWAQSASYLFLAMAFGVQNLVWRAYAWRANAVIARLACAEVRKQVEAKLVTPKVVVDGGG